MIRLVVHTNSSGFLSVVGAFVEFDAETSPFIKSLIDVRAIFFRNLNSGRLARLLLLEPMLPLLPTMQQLFQRLRTALDSIDTLALLQLLPAVYVFI